MINYYPWAVYCESPPSFIWGEGRAKNEGLLYLQSTIDIHILNMFRLTVGIHFQNTLLLPLSLLLCSLLLPNCEGSHSVRLLCQWNWFDCVSVMTEDSIKCSSQVPIVLTSQTGVLASVVAMDTSRGSSDCPWRIQVLPGQQINITLINFARTGLQNDWGKIPTPGSGPRPKICYQLATIKERQFSRTLTECEEGPRESHAYTSTSDSVEIEMIVAKILKVYFLLRYQGIR